MKGREHVYWSIMAFSLVMFAFSIVFGYRQIGSFTWFSLLVTITLSILANEAANTVSSKREKEKRASKAKKDDDKRDKNDPAKKKMEGGMSKLETFLRLSTYGALALTIIVCLYVAIPSSDHPYYLVFGYMVAAFGGTFPDFLDTTITDTMRFHRDPVTHSSLIAYGICLGCVLTVDYDNISINVLGIAFLVGNLSHLLADNFESEGTLADLFVDPVYWKECPGDIRKIREDRERAWLVIHAFFSIALLAFMLARYQLYSWTDAIVIYDRPTMTFSFSPVAISLIVISAGFYAMSCVAFISWKDNGKKVKKKTGTRKMVKRTVPPAT